MRTLKYAILGLVNRKPLTGYDLTKEFSKELNNFWHAKQSQIYPELQRLVDEELLTFDIVITGEVLEKKVYQITEKGKKALHKWLLTEENLPPTPKDPFKLKVYFSECLSKEDILKSLQFQLEQKKAKYTILHDKLKQDYQVAPTPISIAFNDYIVLKAAILREEAYLKWLEEYISLLKQ